MWLYMARERLSVREFAKLIGRPQATVWRLLHGERKANREIALVLEQLEVCQVVDWSRAPRRPFTLPASRKPRTPRPVVGAP